MNSKKTILGLLVLLQAPLFLLTADALIPSHSCGIQRTLRMSASSIPPKAKGYLGKRPRANPYRNPSASTNPIVKAIQNSTTTIKTAAAHDVKFVARLSDMHDRNKRGERMSRKY
jgi:hypothetical protein